MRWKFAERITDSFDMGSKRRRVIKMTELKDKLSRGQPNTVKGGPLNNRRWQSIEHMSARVTHSRHTRSDFESADVSVTAAPMSIASKIWLSGAPSCRATLM